MKLFKLTLFYDLRAAYEGIALVACVAAAMCGVGNNCAAGIVSTSVGAWILTFLLDASLVCGTFSAKRALGSAIWWTAYIVGNAGADRPLLFDLAN